MPIALAILVALLLAPVFTGPVAGQAAEGVPPGGVSTGGRPAVQEPLRICWSDGFRYTPIAFPGWLEVPSWAIEVLREQGSRWPGESIPVADGPGKYLDGDCTPVSWLEGASIGGCVTPAGAEELCDAASVGSPAASGLFAHGTAEVAHPGVEFRTPDGAVTADFDGDHLLITVAPGQPALRFAFDFGAWQVWEVRPLDGTLEARRLEAEDRQLVVETAGTQGASEPRALRYRLVLEHSAGISPFRQSTISLDPSVLSADGSSTATVTLQLLDVLGRPPAEAHEVELFVNAQFGRLGAVRHEGGGRYTATFTAGSAPGTATVVGMVDSLDLDQTEGHVELEPVPPGTVPGNP